MPRFWIRGLITMPHALTSADRGAFLVWTHALHEMAALSSSRKSATQTTHPVHVAFSQSRSCFYSVPYFWLRTLTSACTTQRYLQEVQTIAASVGHAISTVPVWAEMSVPIRNTTVSCL